MNDSGMAGVAAIGAIFGKEVLRGTASKKQKSGTEIMVHSRGLGR